MTTYGNVCLVMDPEMKKSLQRLAIAERTTLSALINRASEKYLKEYVDDNDKVKKNDE
jgi:predicted transcriptional regulator